MQDWVSFEYECSQKGDILKLEKFKVLKEWNPKNITEDGSTSQTYEIFEVLRVVWKKP